ncbi:MAG TPA: AAA family ATPase [Acidimicrobiales bacterium]|nr:AAA family ATPase [Acidimicrobiales bacterium]
MASSTETITILFTDIVGSTALSQRLQPAEADALRQGHFALLRQALAAHDGREVKNLGDGIMAVFMSPSRALACAVAMQQGVEAENHGSALPLGLRIALSGGETTTEDGDYFGDPVVEAARLCAQCDGGQILASDAVRVMVGRRSPHPFNPIGERELKGMPEPVVVCEVGWEPAAIPLGVPLPERLEIRSHEFFGFSGRGQEKALLIEAVKRTTQGSREVAFVSGEPGIGKTSLCRQVAKSAHELGVYVLYGSCDEDLRVSYQPFAEALAHLVVHTDDSVLAQHVADHGGALSNLAPALAKRIPDLSEVQSVDPDSERLRLFGAVVGFLSLASKERGLLLILDDLHWADKASLQLLRHIASSTQLPKVTVLGTYRDSELSAGHPLSDMLASLRRDVPTERIDLLGLEELEIVEMMEQVAGQVMDDEGVDLAHAVRRETDGNPFFTTELLRHLGESGLVSQDETGRWGVSENLYERGLPQSVREVVGQRVDRLGPDVRRVLSQASVIGRDFEVALLAQVVEIDEDRLLDLLDHATGAGLVTEVEGSIDRLTFAHALIQHTLYEDLGGPRCARIHRRVAEALELMCANHPESRAGELAHHYAAAIKTDNPLKALLYSKMAGEQALLQLAPGDAIGWYTQALDLYEQVTPDPVLYCDLLIGFGTALRHTGDAAYRATLLEAAAIAKNLGDGERLVASVLMNGRGLLGGGVAGEVDHERVAVIEEALEVVGPRDSNSRALLLAALSSELMFSTDFERWSKTSGAALEMARRLGDAAVFLRVTGTIYSMSLPDNLGDRLTDLAQALSFAEEMDDPLALCVAHANRALACLQAADRAGFDAHLDAASIAAERLGNPLEQWNVATLRSMGALLAGDTEAAEQHFNMALALASGTVPEATAVYGSQFLITRLAQGRHDEVAGVADLIANAASEFSGLPILRSGLALVYCELGRDDEALELIEADIADQFASFPYDMTWLSSMVVMSEICVRLERTDGAEVLYDRLLPWPSQIALNQTTALGPVALALGNISTLCRRYDDAEEHYHEALDLSRNLRSPFWVARTQIEWSNMLFRRKAFGDEVRARQMVGSALDIADTYGLGGIRARADNLL